MPENILVKTPVTLNNTFSIMEEKKKSENKFWKIILLKLLQKFNISYNYSLA